jgi:hypothetical protein
LQAQEELNPLKASMENEKKRNETLGKVRGLSAPASRHKDLLLTTRVASSFKEKDQIESRLSGHETEMRHIEAEIQSHENKKAVRC